MTRDPVARAPRARADRARQLSFESRPPYRGPRRRDLDGEVLARFRRCVALALDLEPGARVEVEEWVSFDCRETPHTTMVAVSSGGRQLAFSIGKPLDQLGVEDIPVTLRRARAPAARSTAPEAPGRVARRA